MSGFDGFMADAAMQDVLVVQPRMGFASAQAMREGLLAVRHAAPWTIGTITVDAYTRVGQEERAERALLSGAPLNGYPITVHGPQTTADMLARVGAADFPVQMRHGSPDPRRVFKAAAACGLDATEGGPVSYNLPYSRTPLTRTIETWSEAADFWATAAERTGEAFHIETFGGCMLGQLCPPGLLVALSMLEAMFFAEHGVPSISVSLAQGASAAQDIGALQALGRIAERRLTGACWHTVFYSYMGLFPETEHGARALIEDSARVARQGGAQRLIVKTAAEARGIPTIAENVAALQWARSAADAGADGLAVDADVADWAERIEFEAEQLIEATTRLAGDTGASLAVAFAEGVLDVPYCIHPDNRGATRAAIERETGAVVWTNTGAMPIPTGLQENRVLTADSFHDGLAWVRRTYDQREALATTLEEKQ